MPLESWPSQLWAIAVVAALPLVSIAVANLISSSRIAVTIAIPISVLSSLFLLVAELSIAGAGQAAG